MKALGMVLVGCCCTLLTACGSGKDKASDGGKPPEQGASANPRELIVGKWELTGDKTGYKETMDFTADGKVTTVAKAVDTNTWVNTYKFLDDQTIQLYDKKETPTAKYKVEVSKTDLTMTNTKTNKADRYKKIP
jgi:hypothetical protein